MIELTKYSIGMMQLTQKYFAFYHNAILIWLFVDVEETRGIDQS